MNMNKKADQSESGLQFVVGLFLLCFGSVASFLFAVVPYAGPILAFIAVLALGFGFGWVDGFWLRIFGVVGTAAGLFAASVFRFGFSKTAGVLLVLQLVCFLLVFCKTLAWSKPR